MTQAVEETIKSAAKADAHGKGRPRESSRDLVEQVVVAFILAFLIRGFEAEAFVIPTGSMAPTLMGQHKEVNCPQCGALFAVNASEENDGGLFNMRAFGLRGEARASHQVVVGTCSNCRTPVRLDDAPSFKGDRILVLKFLYNLPFLPGGGGPGRWDVVVFHYPEDPEVNYIKRLVGLPNEELRIYFGDVLNRPLGFDGPFQLVRRPLYHQQAMQMLVWDDTHRPKALLDAPEWRRWVGGTKEGSWTESNSGVYTVKATAGDHWSYLRYRHLVPDPEQWKAILAGDPLPRKPRPTLITDFYAYNSGLTADRRSDASDWFQPHWVGDLTVSAKLTVKSATGRVRFELVEGGVANHCEIDLSSGLATLAHGATILNKEPVATGIKGPGTYDVTFANVDDRLTLWVDGKTPFGDGLAFGDGSGDHPAPTAADLEPASISARGAEVSVSGLVLKRDIYYTQSPGQSDYRDLAIGWPSGPFDPERRVIETFDLLADPSKFLSLGQLQAKDYKIGPGRYMMMGDNSPRSKDGRGWQTNDRYNPDFPEQGWDTSDRQYYEVPESLLIGKAFFIYWPHGKPFGPDIRVNRDFRIPFRPYFERMKWIR
jgi:hypothetical protein